MNEMKKIILTFDLEYWFESLSIKKYLSGDEVDDVSKILNNILPLLENKNYKATFFVTKKILENEHQLIKKINKLGHEIAIHSADHSPLWKKNSTIFDKEIKTMISLIENITNQKPIGHRAVNFSLDNNTKWALKVLSKNNIKYDSSIFPCKLPKILRLIFKDILYGVQSNLFSAYKISFENISSKDSSSPIYEVPISILSKKNIKIPVTGGIYIRLIPWLIFKYILKKKLSTEVACMHFHPFDFMDYKPNIKMPILKKFIKFYNTKNTLKKINYIIEKYECTSIKNYLYENTSN